MRPQRAWTTILLIAAISTCAPAAAAELETVPFSPEKVDAAIEKGQEYLFSTQLEDGYWKPHGAKNTKGWYPVGPTALVTYALLESGVSPQDPRIEKAVRFLRGQKTPKTYGLGLRAQVWLAMMRGSNARLYRHLLEQDVRELYRSTADGSYGYFSLGRGKSKGDHSNSQYGVLGVWAGARGDVTVPREYWELVMKHWLWTQLPDGGWGYAGRNITEKYVHPPSYSMTAAGLASVYVCIDNLFQEKFISCDADPQFKPVAAGMAWLEKNFTDALAGTPAGGAGWAGRGRYGWGDFYYFLYAVERVGLASGYKYFGDADWYKMGTERLLVGQNDDGSFGLEDKTSGLRVVHGKDVTTSYALLFLARGRHPVLFNKLRYDGRWNNRPRDLASLTRWISRQFETTVGWQIINLDVPVDQWHDAPILYIAGSEPPTFTDDDIDKLRTFVHQGGTIFSVAECNGEEFTAAMREAYKRMFPRYELSDCGDGHPLYSAYFDLGPDPRRGRRESQVRYAVVSNGVRPLAVHTETDLTKLWQLGDYRQGWAYQAAANVFMYVTDSGSLRARGVNPWPGEPGALSRRAVSVVRLAHNAGHDPEPLAWERFARMLQNRTGTRLQVSGPVDIRGLANTDAKTAVMTGVGTLELSDDQRTMLKDWIDAGGTLVIDAAGGDEQFADSARAMIDATFGSPGDRVGPLKRLALGSPVYQLTLSDGTDLSIDEVRYRRKTAARLGTDAAKAPNLMFVPRDDGTPAVLFSREDITVGLLGYPSQRLDGYQAADVRTGGSSYEIMRNILLYLHQQSADDGQ